MHALSQTLLGRLLHFWAIATTSKFLFEATAWVVLVAKQTCCASRFSDKCFPEKERGPTSRGKTFTNTITTHTHTHSRTHTHTHTHTHNKVSQQTYFWTTTNHLDRSYKASFKTAVGLCHARSIGHIRAYSLSGVCFYFSQNIQFPFLPREWRRLVEK